MTPTVKMVAAFLFTKFSSMVMFRITTAPNTNICGFLAYFNNLFVISTDSSLTFLYTIKVAVAIA